MVVGLWATRVAVMDGDGAVVAEHARAYGCVLSTVSEQNVHRFLRSSRN